jgi:hypothetical protein
VIVRARTRAALVALALASCSHAEPAPGPEPVVPGASGEPASCAGCHPAEHAEWSTSRHAAAWTDPIFQAEFARGRPAWCVGCHAPLARDPLDVDDADVRASQGVGCAGCHLRDGRMVSLRVAPGSPHDTAVDPAFESTALCARCHEFSFPILGERGRLERYTGEPMQATVSQFLQSGLAGAMACADCHAATGAGHAFPGSHDPAMVASALEISLCHARLPGERDAELVIELANQGAGHNVPTGGVHRHMVLRAWRSTSPERLWEAYLGRRFRPLPGGGKETVLDTTLAPDERRRFRVPERQLGLPAAAPGESLDDPSENPPGEPINVELRYVYALDEHTPLDGAVISRAIWRRRTSIAQTPPCEAAGARVAAPD